MKVTTKELRIQPGKIIDRVVSGEEIVITFRGKALARIVPIQAETAADFKGEEGVFGMWSAHETGESPEDEVRRLREARSF